jgi:uncharacterized protein YbcC (UPF0753/DUF2309 family)
MASFVTSNPLSGYEGMPFEKAVNQARILNANVFPESTVFRQAWEKGEIDENILLKLLGENQLLESPSIIYNKWHLIKKAMLKQPS